VMEEAHRALGDRSRMTEETVQRCTWAPDPEGDPARLTYTFGGAAPVASIPSRHRRRHVDARLLRGRRPHRRRPAEPGLRPALPQPADRSVLRRGRRAGRHARRPLRLDHPALRPRRQQHRAVLRLADGDADHRAAPPRAARAHLGVRDRRRGGRRPLRRARHAVHRDLPLDPMHGTVGVAPALGEVRRR
jgi:hypothetical protein